MTANAKARLEKVNRVLDSNKLAKVAHEYFKKVTPIDSGNARRSTTVQGDTVYAKYPYAGRLNEGYSKQAPKGMVQPTIEFLRQYVKQQLG
jgi:hypothetical protein